MRKRMLSLLLALVLVLSLVPTAGAALTPETSANMNAQSYHDGSDYSRWSQPVKSYLHAISGGMERVEYIKRSSGDLLVAEQYTMDGEITGRKTLSIELPLFGGFFAGAKYNFVVFGQENPEESNEVEVIRVVRYSKAWKRLDSVGLYGENTYIPFEAGSLRMAEDDAYLYVNTCHEMYAISGIHHQANLAFGVRQSDMTVTDVRSDVSNFSTGYVSHSFNQFITVDDGHVVALDHGDANNTRGAVLYRNQAVDANGRYLGGGERIRLKAARSAKEDEHYNSTGMNLGGLVATSSHYLAVGGSIDQTTSDNSLNTSQRNIFVAAVPKDDLSGKVGGVRWLTSYAEGDNVVVSTPQIVQISASKSLLLWYAEDLLHYVFLKADGSTDGKIYTAYAALSDCAPTVIDGKVYWYVTENLYSDARDGSTPTFYCIDPENPDKVTSTGLRTTGMRMGSVGYLTYTFDPSNGQMTIGGTGEVGFVLYKDIPWNGYRDEIRSLVVEDGVTDFGYNFFENCPNLKSVTLGSDVEEIAGTAFANSGVSAISVSAKNTHLSVVDGVVFNKDHSTLLCYPGGRSGAYSIPSGTSYVSYNAFCGCPNLTAIRIPASVSYIHSAIYDCPALKEISVDAANEHYTSMDGVLFSRDKTELVRFPEGKSGSYTVPAGTKRIADGAFADCTALQSLCLPTGVSFGADAVENCTSLKQIYFGGTKAQWEEFLQTTSSADQAVLSKATVYYSSVFLTAQPESVSAVVGDTASFTVKATGSGLKYQWQYQAPDGSWTDCSSATTGYNQATLKVEATEARNGYRYRCRVTDANGSYMTSSAAKLTVTAKPTSPPEPTATPTTTNPFKDVKSGQYYTEPVLWAVNHDPQITTGTSKTTFEPDASCTRGQMVTFLWRAAGCPQAKTTKNPFTDVKKGDFYYDAVLWAAEKGITTGTSKTTFAPNATVNRAQSVTFLWRMAGEPSVSGKNPFTDVKSSQYYTDAVIWASQTGVTTGTSKTTFAPDDPCVRGQIVTFLYRYDQL